MHYFLITFIILFFSYMSSVLLRYLRYFFDKILTICISGSFCSKNAVQVDFSTIFGTSAFYSFACLNSLKSRFVSICAILHI